MRYSARSRAANLDHHRLLRMAEQMTRKLLLLAAGIFMAVGFAAAPALAGGDQYAPTNLDGSVNDDDSVTVTGENCPPGSTVEWRVNRGASGNGPEVDSGSTTADDDGNFSFTTDPLPNGRYLITVTCGDDSAVLGVNVNAGNPRITATPNPNASARLTGQNFDPNTPYTYEVRRAGAQGFAGSIRQTGELVDSGSGDTDGNGSFVRNTAIVGPGRYDVVVESGGLQASTVLVVPAGAAGGGQGKGGDLASTGGGDGSIPLARLGVILVASGGVALYAGKKRQGRRAAFVNA